MSKMNYGTRFRSGMVSSKIGYDDRQDLARKAPPWVSFEPMSPLKKELAVVKRKVTMEVKKQRQGEIEPDTKYRDAQMDAVDHLDEALKSLGAALAVMNEAARAGEPTQEKTKIIVDRVALIDAHRRLISVRKRSVRRGY